VTDTLQLSTDNGHEGYGIASHGTQLINQGRKKSTGWPSHDAVSAWVLWHCWLESGLQKTLFRDTCLTLERRSII